MTDDISKVDLKLLQDVVSNILWPNGGTYAEEVQAIIDRLESATTPAEVEAIGDVLYELETLESDVNGVADYTGRVRAHIATLARQLAEADRQNKIMREADYHAAGVAQEQEIIELKSQLAEATRRVGEVEAALSRFLSDAEQVDLGGGDAVVTTCESLQAAQAALTKEPTK